MPHSSNKSAGASSATHLQLHLWHFQAYSFGSGVLQEKGRDKRLLTLTTRDTLFRTARGLDNHFSNTHKHSP